MPNKDIFSTESRAAPADTENLAGGRAYAMSHEGALAKLACTGTFNGTFYASGKQQFDWFMDAAKQCSDRYVAQVAIYARHSGFMKDAPAALVTYLFAKGSEYFRPAFDRVITNGKMLRNFVQMVRSGAMGRKSFGTRGKKAIQHWLTTATPIQIMRASVGNQPSLRDILRMVHVKPADKARAELFNWVVNGEFDADTAPRELVQLRDWLDGGKGVPPQTDHRMLEFKGMTADHWRTIGRKMGWMGLRMNLNTLLRHDAFKGNDAYIGEIAERLRNAEQIARAKQFPYQMYQAWRNTEGVPHQLQEGLQDALELSLMNIPELPGEIAVIVDTSGSMKQSVTGGHDYSGKSVSCVDVAAVFAAALARKNPGRVTMIPVDTQVHPARINSRDPVVTMAKKLASYGGGGTNLSAAMQHLQGRLCKKCNLVVMISDNESWGDYLDTGYYGSGLGEAWVKYRRFSPGAKLVNIDIVGSRTSQTKPESDVLMVSGFSDTVFKVVEAFVEGGHDGDFWVNKIKESMAL